MKAFWTSVVIAIIVAIVAGVVLNYGITHESRDIYQSPRGSVHL